MRFVLITRPQNKEKCKEKNITVGTFVDIPQNAVKWKKLGVKYISYSVDMGIFYEAMTDIVKTVSKSN